MVYVGLALALALGFGLGRVKHPANLKLANVQAEISKLEAEAVADVKIVLSRLKQLL